MLALDNFKSLLPTQWHPFRLAGLQIRRIAHSSCRGVRSLLFGHRRHHEAKRKEGPIYDGPAHFPSARLDRNQQAADEDQQERQVVVESSQSAPAGCGPPPRRWTPWRSGANAPPCGNSHARLAIGTPRPYSRTAPPGL